MDNFYVWIVIGCLLIFLAVMCLFAPKPEKEVSRHAIVSKIFKKYSYIPDTHDDPLFINLTKVNTLDPQKRPPNKMDKWFYDHTLQLMHSGECLAYINHYGYLEETFWKNIEKSGFNPETDKTFQYLLISVSKYSWGVWLVNFSNLLFHFGMHYQFLHEVKNVLKTDSRLESSKDVYDSAHEFAEPQRC